VAIHGTGTTSSGFSTVSSESEYGWFPHMA
jgi:hypothetical protein